MLNINTQSLPEQQDFAPIKADVPFVVDTFGVDTDPNNGLQYLNLKIQVVDGEHKGRVLFDDFKGLLDGTSEAWNNTLGFNVTEASGARIRTLLEAVGLSQLTDPSQLVGKMGVAQAYPSKPNKNTGKIYQKIGKYLPMGAQTQQPQQQAYTQQQPVQQQQTNPFASGNSTPQANPFAPR